MKHASHKAQLDRMKRIEGQVRGVAKMVEEERYCVDIITQIKAVRSALAAVEAEIVNNHLDHCVTAAVRSSDKRKTDKMLEEIKSILKSATK